MTDTNRRVPFFNYPHVFKADEEAYCRIFKEIGSRGAFIMQDELVQFEKDLATFAGCRYAIGVANGTDAIFIALRAAGVGRGDEVIFCSHTMVATAAAIDVVGAIPVPVECGSDRLIDPRSISEAITPRTRAILPTQLNGRTCKMDALLEIAAKNELIIVEDAAQALGSRFKGQAAGTFGAAGTISFYPAKSLGCFGDGGAILTNDQRMYDQMMLLRDHGRNKSGEVILWGYNSRLDNLQAAILSHKLRSFPEVIARRRELAALYGEELGSLSSIGLPPLPGSGGEHFDTFQNFEIEADRRDELVAFLKANGVGTLIQWGGKAVHQFAALGLKAALPKTEHFFSRCLMLPLNMSLSNEDVSYVADTIKRFYRAH